MSMPIIPLVFEPIFKAKPWGGRELRRLFNKTLPADTPIGESWELSDLPGAESRVRQGALEGASVGDIMRMWGKVLLGHAEPSNGRFPLLIKFLDAREKLSVQVHPRPRDRSANVVLPGVKNEAWCVLDANPGAELYIGLKPGVGPDDVARAASTDAIADLLMTRLGAPGCCYYLPSGTPHALGAGLVVAEVQTPSDVTYRLYDWGRAGLDGRPRDLHVEQALENIRYDVATTDIVQPGVPRRDDWREVERIVTCEHFLIDRVKIPIETQREITPGKMAIWIIVHGKGRFIASDVTIDFHSGHVLLLPAALARVSLEVHNDLELLEVGIPAPTATNNGPKA